MKNKIKHPRIYMVLFMIVIDYIYLTYGGDLIISRPIPSILIGVYFIVFVLLIGVTATIIANYIKNKFNL